MAKRQRHTPEQIISKLREAEVKLAKGTALAQVCKDLAITEQTYYRWRKEYGGMKLDRARRLKDLEKENARLKRLLADAELDKAILKEAAPGKYPARRRAEAGGADGRAGHRIRALRLPPGGGPAEGRGLRGQPQAPRAAVAA